MERKLLKIKLQAEPFDEALIKEKRKEIIEKLDINEKEVLIILYLPAQASNTTYDPRDERINILFKDGTVKDISKVDNALDTSTLGQHG